MPPSRRLFQGRNSASAGNPPYSRSGSSATVLGFARGGRPPHDLLVSSPVLSHLTTSQDGHVEHDGCDDLDDILTEVILAIDMKDSGNVGCAYYVAAEETLYMLHDIPCGDIDVVDLLLLHAQPTSVLASTRANHHLISHLDNRSSHPTNSSDKPTGGGGAYIIRQIGSAEFLYEPSVQRLLHATSVSLAGSASAEEGEASASDLQARTMKLGTIVNLDSILSVSLKCLRMCASSY